MNTTEGYEPHSFLALFYPNQDTNTQKLKDGFVTTSGMIPDHIVTTETYSVCISLSSSAQIACDDEKNLTVILNGEIYNTTRNDQAKYLLEQFVSEGPEFASEINGTFAILLINRRSDVVQLITDRLNTKRVFCGKLNGHHWLSTKLHSFLTDGSNIDIVGAACYLANGAVHNNRTLFDGVRSLERASIHRLGPDGFKGETYWSYQFLNSYAGVSEKELRAELAELIVESVRLRLRNDPKVFLSLSGGYDASGLLGVLSSLKVPDVCCLSYTFGKASANHDAHVASQMAKLVGYDCRIPQCHRGDIVASIKNNAEMGCGVGPYCNEADAWLEMEPEFSSNANSVLLAGDNCFGFDNGVTMRSQQDALINHNQIQNFDDLKWFAKLIGKKNYNTMCEGLQNDISQIVNRSPESEDPYDLASFIYLDQRVPNVLIPWREFFPGKYLNAVEPYLDNSIMDFLMKVPNSMKHGRRLYRDTVTEMFPEIFEIKRATHGGGTSSWRSEFISQRQNIDSSMLSNDSRLDSLIPPQAITKLLNEISSWKHHKYSPRILPSRFALIVLKGKWMSDKILDLFPIVDHKTLLKRLLLMRTVLERTK